MHTRSLRGRLLGHAMLSPAIVVLIALIIGPLAYSVVLSGYSWKLTDINAAKPFFGLANYGTLLTDQTVRVAVANTVLYVVGTLGCELLLGFVVATALFEMTRGRRLANALILLPMIIAPVITIALARLAAPSTAAVSCIVSVP